jgi:TPR repeat protein
MAYLAADNRQKARDYLNRVCRFGGEDLIHDPEAMFLVAESLLEEGRIDDAVPWLLRAGEQDEADALLQLGLLSMSGKGLLRNERQGAEYLRRSAECGNAAAAYNLGVYYEHIERGFVGRTNWRRLAFGGEAERPSESFLRAFEWYRRAAEAEYPPAQDRMGDFFASGQIVGRDLAVAREWYTLAAMQDYPEAKEKLSNLGG